MVEDRMGLAEAVTLRDARVFLVEARAGPSSNASPGTAPSWRSRSGSGACARDQRKRQGIRCMVSNLQCINRYWTIEVCSHLFLYPIGID